MNRIGRLFAEVTSPRNLWRAWRDFRRGKRSRPSVLAFEPEADGHVLALHRSLDAATYRPGPYRLTWIEEPKRRLIAAAPVRDRVVHHAIHRVVAPRLDRSFVETTFACLPGRGSHRAVLCFREGLRRHRYVLMLDVRRYFLSIDHVRLLAILARKLKDRRLLDLFAIILAGGDGIYRNAEVARLLELPPGFPPPRCGLPIGNLTSQWWGNVYLAGLDHYVKRDLRIPHAQRYMDDVALMSASRAQLEEARAAVAEWLRRERGLELKDPNADVHRAAGRFRYLGFRVSRAAIAPGDEVLAKMRRRLRRLALDGDIEKLRRSIASYRGLWAFDGSAES